MSSNDSGEVTRLLQRVRENDAQGSDELFQRLDGELRALAHVAMQRDRAGHTLQPTAIVHEA